MTDHPRLTRYAPYANGTAFMGMLRQNDTHPEMFGPDFDWTHGPYVLASEADAEIERLRAEVERLRSDQPQDQSQDQSICGDDGPITPEECARWLEAQYARHGELEDRAAAQWLRRLCAEVERLTRELSSEKALRAEAEDFAEDRERHTALVARGGAEIIAERDRWHSGPMFRRVRQRKIGNLTISVLYGQIWVENPAQGCVSLSVDEYGELAKLARAAHPVRSKSHE